MRCQRKQNLPAKAPKPVHTTSIQHHALFGPTYVKQHMMFDNSWKTEDLTDEYELITSLLKRHLIFEEMEKKHRQMKLSTGSKKLRQQVNAGRVELQLALATGTQHKLRLILGNHKDMQRLYVKMPLNEVLDNITQRTFLMRKERDRWHLHLAKLSSEMEKKKMEQGQLENRLYFLNEFNLEEQSAYHEINKQIQNSETRLQSLQTIHNTYKKMVQVLQHDGKFYEPILESLSKDIDDQQVFVSHIIHIGNPAIEKLKELQHESWKTDETHRKQRRSKRSWIWEMHRVSQQAARASTVQPTRTLLAWKKRYVRETSSMMQLKRLLMEMEKDVRKLQEATLCSRAMTIYPTFKQQSKLNYSLGKQIPLLEIHCETLKSKAGRSKEKKQSIVDEIVALSLKRDEKISHLKKLIAEEDDKEKQFADDIKQHSNSLVVLRCFLWNAFDILRHVQVRTPSHIKPIEYTKSYMRLPLLTFELLEMTAVPPQHFDQNTINVLNIVTEKLKKVSQAYMRFDTYQNANERTLLEQQRNDYVGELLDLTQKGDTVGDMITTDTERPPLESPKPDITIPTRAFIKSLSAKVVEERSTMDD